jgi:plasmid maintenance system antidote protein VapI
MKGLPNSHPGAVLLEAFLIPLGISQNALAWRMYLRRASTYSCRASAA